MELSNISWEQCAEYLARDNRIILPIGATEQHGRHLGLGTDYLIAQEIARRIGEHTNTLVAPTLNYGMSHFHLEFAGTISLSPTTLSAVLEDIFQSLYRHGFRRVLVVNGHGGNQPSIHSAASIVQNQLPDLRVKFSQWWLAPEILRMVDETLGAQRGTHASNHETALMRAVAPDAVHTTRIAKRDAPVVPENGFDSPTRFREKFPDGVMGLDPSAATTELGERILEKSVALGILEMENWL
jgi:creatinine amidohydrolase